MLSKWMPALVLISFHAMAAVTVAAEQNASAPAKHQGSHLIWVLTDHSTGKVLSRGDDWFSSNTLQIKKGADFQSKWLTIGQGFQVGIHAKPEKSASGPGGFGIWLKREGHRTFSWDWFNVAANFQARKLQGPGQLAFTMKQVNGAYEIATIKVLSDFSLRCVDQEDNNANVKNEGYGVPYRWECKILKDSLIEVIP